MADDKMIPDDLVFPGVDGHGAIEGVAAGLGVAKGVVGAAAGDHVGGFIPAAQVLAQQRALLRWIEPMSAFMLRQMCQLISTGVRTNKGFKEVHLN